MMKILGVLLVLAVAAQAVPVELEDDIAARNVIVDALIGRAVEYVRDIIVNGHDELGVPVLDPLRIFATDLKFPGRLLNVDLSLAGAEMKGIGDFITDLDFSLLRLTLNYDILIENIKVTSAHYNMTGLIAGIIPLYGQGRADFELVNLRMKGVALMGREGSSLIIKEMRDATFSLDKFLANTSGYLHGGDMDKVMNAILEDLVADYVTRFSRSISKFTTPHISTAANSMLSRVDAWDMIFG